MLRPEWSKGWGYDAADGPWSNGIFIGNLPGYYGKASDTLTFNWAKGVLADADPKNIFSNPLLDQLFK